MLDLKRRKIYTLIQTLVCLATLLFSIQSSAQVSPADFGEDDIEIVEGESKTVYEYRQNGILMMIKVVPNVGKPYYMVPADGSPHFDSLDHKKTLYPQWRLIEF